MSMGDSSLTCKHEARLDFSPDETIILFVVAHPDDESMFFFPSIRHFLRECPRRNVSLLCLTNGNYDNLGRLRSKELHNAGKILGFHPENITVIDDERFQDGPNEKWDASIISSAISEHIGRLVKRNGNKFHIKIFTFDQYGISSHPNHIDTWNGVKHFQRYNAKVQFRSGDDRIVVCDMFELQTVNVFHKYIVLFDIVLLIVKHLLLSLFNWFGCFGKSTGVCVKIPDVVCLAFNPIDICRAMAAHHSQFVWYRRLFIMFSRYSYINNFRKTNDSSHR